MKNENAQNVFEAKQEFQRAELIVERPRGDRDVYRISFAGTDARQCEAYNRAIDLVTEDHMITMLHHSDTGSYKDVGTHVWEVTTAATSEFLEKLMPEIHAKAEEVFNRWRAIARFQNE